MECGEPFQRNSERYPMEEGYIGQEAKVQNDDILEISSILGRCVAADY